MCKKLMAKMVKPYLKHKRKNVLKKSTLRQTAPYYKRDKYRGEACLDEKIKMIKKFHKEGWTLHGIAWKVVLPKSRVIMILGELGLALPS